MSSKPYAWPTPVAHTTGPYQWPIPLAHTTGPYHWPIRLVLMFMKVWVNDFFDEVFVKYLNDIRRKRALVEI
jgi:hypothetical protein